jgi:hypothetical protein
MAALTQVSCEFIIDNATVINSKAVVMAVLKTVKRTSQDAVLR